MGKILLKTFITPCLLIGLAMANCSVNPNVVPITSEEPKLIASVPNG